MAKVKYAAASLAILGLASLVAWMLVNDGSATSLLLLLSGIGVLTLAILLYFFSPSRYLRADVSGAMAISATLSLNKMLSSLLVISKGMHLPSGQAGAPKLFLPLSGALSAEQLSSLRPGEAVFDVSGNVKGIALLPPGRGLFAYAQSIGASFTEEGLENEVKDVMENGLELASKVSLRREGGRILVTMQGLAGEAMCAAIRKEDAGICARTCCPICSFVACMVAEGTNKKVRMESVKVDGETINVAYELI
jgi:hypothetical protein